MKNRLFIKLSLIALVSLLLLVPLSMIEGQIAARSARQADVRRDIAESAAGAQNLVGPVLAIRYRERVERQDKDRTEGAARYELVERTRVLAPQKLDIDGVARVESRSRGLYRARLYHLDLHIVGSVVVPARLGFDAARDIVEAQAFLVLGLTDLRGVENDPQVRINGQPHRFVAGNAGALGGPGVHVALGLIDLSAGNRFDFSVPLNVAGTERLAIAPAGDATTVSLKSDWPHPSFQGRFLPVARTVSDEGFEARWEVSHLARNFDRMLKATAPDGPGETLDIGFMDPVNVYLQSERAVKYGVLFVVLTFAAFFLTEILRQLRIHPMQYLLVGLALATFFLLLIALSEHMSFALAYGTAATACVALIGAYLAGALGSRRRGLAGAAGVGALYAVLYGVLLSEDNALLMGTLLIFAALGATMLATRTIDWYRLGEAKAA